jgi:hypothetical protein
MSRNTNSPIYYDSTHNIKFNGGKEYYEIDGIYYIGTFPIDWATNHIEYTGPISCMNCQDYGSYNGVFIGYCANCSEYVYEGKRGRGFMNHGVEKENDDNEIVSVFDTYLKHMDPDIVNIESIDIGENSHEKINIKNNYPEIDYSELTDYDMYGYCVDEEDIGYYGYSSYGSDFNGGYDSY